MQASRAVSRPSAQDPGPRLPTEYESFLALLQQNLGTRLCGLLEDARSSSVAYPLSEFSAEAQRKLRLITASDAMRHCLEPHYGIELACTADNALELRSYIDRNSRPPIVAEEVYKIARDELPLAMGIINLVNDHVGRGDGGYYAHVPIGLAAGEQDELLRLMSIRSWRKALEMRLRVHFGFRAPYHLAAARDIGNNYLRQFVSLEEQARTGLPFPDP